MYGSWKNVRGGVTAPEGFSAAGISCGIKDSGKKDLALLLSERPARWGAVLTTSLAPAAPVILTRALLRRRLPLQAVLVNSGNANSATGEPGKEAARSVAAAAAERCGLPPSSVVMASTGIIGVQLPAGKITRCLSRLVDLLSPTGGKDAARAIMTTDRVPKEEALELKLRGGRKIRIGGMAKGAGMIDPKMATMLAFVTTDADLPRAVLDRLLRRAVESSFNRITIDGDMSTNDTVLVMANGASGVPVAAGSAEEKLLAEGLTVLCRRLAAAIVRDGEGATKFVEVRVTGARSSADALKAARAVATSALVKTAWYGEDLNWGRILAALGYSGAQVKAEKVSITVNGKEAVGGGEVVPRGELSRARREMKRAELFFVIDLGLGRGEESVLTCDFSLDYVRENALYTT